MNNHSVKSIVLFDGICNFCNSSVTFIIHHDKKEQFLFASLQSDVAKEVLLQFGLKKLNFDAIVLVEKENIYQKSSAVLKIVKQLSGSIKLLYAFIIVPHILRNWVYDYIAKNRYKWFGKKEKCMVPSDTIKSRFLDLL